MSKSQSELDEIKERREKALQVIWDLCQGKLEWVMSIPARPDYDPDLIIHQSLTDLGAVVADFEVERQAHQKTREGLADLKAELAEWKASHAKIMSEQCPSDEVHCTCVPSLRQELDRERESVNELSLHSQDLAAELLGLRKRLHWVEGHNQIFERCENPWCHPDREYNPALEFKIPHSNRSDELKEELANLSALLRECLPLLVLNTQYDIRRRIESALEE